MLLRMDAPSLSEHQYDFFREPPFPQLELELRRWANEPVDYRKLLMDLERYELSQSTTDAHALPTTIKSCVGRPIIKSRNWPNI